MSIVWPLNAEAPESEWEYQRRIHGVKTSFRGSECTFLRAYPHESAPPVQLARYRSATATIISTARGNAASSTSNRGW